MITALYERLSRDDEQLRESNSITNQKIYLENYAQQHGFANCQHYIDDGYRMQRLSPRLCSYCTAAQRK